MICSTDNDFNQCVRGDRIVVLDRIRNVVTDEAAVAHGRRRATQIPDLFALVGDRSDGLPGVPGWGLRSAAAVLRRYGSVDGIPLDEQQWDIVVRSAARLAAALHKWQNEVLICRDLAELRPDLPLRGTIDDLAWRGADRSRLERTCNVLGDDSVITRIGRWANGSAA